VTSSAALGPEDVRVTTSVHLVPARSNNMRAIKRRDTRPELAVRRLLHARGSRFRVDMPIRLDGLRPIRPDIVFPRQRVAVFIDGCFWHGCPEHGRRPNLAGDPYWAPKLARTAQRDSDHTEVLTRSGWVVLRFWEHEDPGSIVSEIRRWVASNRREH
jgi:DNA mismatch endonuclease (patch repair protein)